jgi:type II secretory pathway pseudopilin PulG
VSRAHARRAQAGFTMIELVISLAAGLAVSLAGFLLARNASQVFQQEANVSTAQLANTFGVARLGAELARAAFMSSPNVQVDPKRCGDMSDWPDALKRLASITIEENGSKIRHSADHTLSDANNLKPDAFILGGAFGTVELFTIDRIETTGGGAYDVYFDLLDEAYQRLLSDTQSGGLTLAEIFRPGRFARIIDSEGRHLYGVVSAVDASATAPKVTLANTPKLPSKPAGSPCGLAAGANRGLRINPVARVLYDLRKIDPTKYPRYKGLYAKATSAASGKHVGATEAARTELVRVELDQEEKEIDATLEVVAEYGVDLKFGLSRATPGIQPTIERYPLGNATVYSVTALPTNGGTPQRARALQVRFSTRASEKDRSSGLTAGDGGLLRYKLGTDAFARMRTVVVDVALPNLASVTW